MNPRTAEGLNLTTRLNVKYPGVEARRPVLSVTEREAERAFEAWGANCGPGALAAILGVSLFDVRQYLGDFEQKRYTNPTLMYAALDLLGVPWRKIGKAWPAYGLVRVQWEGPWTDPGVPMRARYRYTHWIGTAVLNGNRGIFDINCVNNGSGWVSLEDWEREIAPFLAGGYKHATGCWHIANSLEVGLAGGTLDA